MNSFQKLEFSNRKMSKMKKLISKGVTIYPYRFDRTMVIADLKSLYENIGHEKSEKKVKIAGRIYRIRYHGRVIFADIKDESGKIQLYLRENDLGEEQFKLFKECIDTGDIIGVCGSVFRTKMGEISIWVDEFILLAKSLCPLPEKFHGLKNIERRYRQRYLDLIVNDDIRNVFRIRSKVVSFIRKYLEKRGFLEFETPILQPIYGGANARPFITYHNYLDQNFYLRIAPELYLKRLIVGGFEKVFEVARNFRNEDIDVLHNPEFTMVEIYEAYKDYNDMMDLCEDMISQLVWEIHGKYEITFGDTTINFKKPWNRISMEEAVKKYVNIDIWKHSFEELKEIAKDYGIENYGGVSSHREFLVFLFENLVEKKLIQPTFIYDYPIEISPLAKKHREKEGFTERFELFINGWEIANGFSELNDPIDQKMRFEEQEKKRRLGDLEAQMIDYDYINALGYGMPPTGGVGIGIDRLVMILTNKRSIKEVILFPQMKIG